LLGIFLQLSKQTTFLFTFPENRKQNWNVCWYSVVNFEMRRLPELAAWITQFFQNRHQKKWRAWKDFFLWKKNYFFSSKHHRVPPSKKKFSWFIINYAKFEEKNFILRSQINQSQRMAPKYKSFFHFFWIFVYL